MTTPRQASLDRQIRRALKSHLARASDNLDWLLANMHPYFFITMKEETQALVNLAASLHA